MTSATPISSVVLTRYAGALLDLAEDAKSADKIQKDLNDIAQMIDSSAELEEVIASPRVSREKQAAVIEDLSKKAKFQKLTKNFLGVLVENRRLDALKGVIAVYNKMVSKRAGEVSVQVETAIKLTATQEKEFKKKIESALGHSVSVEPKVTPEILGGMIVTIGSYMVDDSVRRKIDRLGVALKSGSNQNTVQNLKEVV